MVAPVIAAAAVAAVVSSAFSIFGSSKAASQQREAARAQGHLTYAQRMEEIRRAELSNVYTQGQASAVAAAGGVEKQGTPQQTLSFMRTEFARQIDYSKDAAVQERKAIRSGAPGVGATNLANVGTAFAGLSQALSIWDKGS